MGYLFEQQRRRKKQKTCVSNNFFISILYAAHITWGVNIALLSRIAAERQGMVQHSQGRGRADGRY